MTTRTETDKLRGIQIDQMMGDHVTVTVPGAQGHLELNMFGPVSSRMSCNIAGFRWIRQ
jgi:fumarate hydratase class II